MSIILENFGLSINEIGTDGTLVVNLPYILHITGYCSASFRDSEEPDRSEESIEYYKPNVKINGVSISGVALERSEERRVGKEGRSRWSPYH